MNLLELFEDALALLRFNSWAAVPNLQDELILAHAQGQQHAAAGPR